MQFNQVQFAAIVETARAKAADHVRWIRAIDRAAAGLLDGSICVTLFADDTALVTTATGQHRVNGQCECAAAKHGHKECVHRVAKRLAEMMEETTTPVVSCAECPGCAEEAQYIARHPMFAVSSPRIVRSVERDHTGARVRVTRCDNWLI